MKVLLKWGTFFFPLFTRVSPAMPPFLPSRYLWTPSMRYHWALSTSNKWTPSTISTCYRSIPTLHRRISWIVRGAPRSLGRIPQSPPSSCSHILLLHSIALTWHQGTPLRICLPRGLDASEMVYCSARAPSRTTPQHTNGAYTTEDRWRVAKVAIIRRPGNSSLTYASMVYW